MVSTEIAGMLLMAVTAASCSACTMLCTLVKDLHIPYYRLSGTAALLLAGGLLLVICVQGEFSKVQRHQWKWIWLRGAFGCATMLLGWTAVVEGAPMGDASALGSVNVVVAALLGRIVLGEPLRFLHILALIASLAGAMIVTRPDDHAAHTQHAESGTAWLGYSLALGAGITSGGLFIASRKSQGISPIVMSFSVSLHEGVTLWVVATYGLIEDGPVEPILTSPLAGIFWVAALFFLFSTATATMSIGSQLCPAAASSTIYTSVAMSFGYIVQTVLHGQRPTPLKVVGAALMLLAVALIAAARWWQSKESQAKEVDDPLLSGEPVCSSDLPSSSTAVAECEEVESLASFIAAEFSGVTAAQKRSMRQRRTIAAVAQGLVRISA
jgi:drug/metabolite transporter (DMT)-like permease